MLLLLLQIETGTLTHRKSQFSKYNILHNQLIIDRAAVCFRFFSWTGRGGFICDGCYCVRIFSFVFVSSSSVRQKSIPRKHPPKDKSRAENEKKKREKNPALIRAWGSRAFATRSVTQTRPLIETRCAA